MLIIIILKITLICKTAMIFFKVKKCSSRATTTTKRYWTKRKGNTKKRGRLNQNFLEN